MREGSGNLSALRLCPIVVNQQEAIMACNARAPGSLQVAYHQGRPSEDAECAFAETGIAAV
jgi:hypothetical protein